MAFTLGAVAAMVLSADLVAFSVFWCLTSVGLHNLLLHYADRQQRGAPPGQSLWLVVLGDVAVLSLSACTIH